MSKIWNILLVGVGGQGIVLSSDILSAAALAAGFDVKKSEIHGMSQRGGSVFSHVRFGERIYSPLLSEGSADILISMEEMESLRWLRFARPDTRMFVSRTRILPAMTEKYPEGIEEWLKKRFKDLTMIDTEEMIKKIESPKYLNTLVLGLIAEFLPFDDRVWESAIGRFVPEKTLPKNLEVFRMGRV